MKVIVRGVDLYGRSVGEVILLDGQNLDQELVRAGLAWWYIHFALRDRVLASIQAEAREAKRGLCADKNPRAAAGVAESVTGSGSVTRRREQKN